jgi:DNA repair protein RecN (Recombination protein N)
MLVSLAIRDIVLIERLDIAFAPGLTVLTGETGAGKSILLDALTLALGGRGDAGLVRTDAAQGQVSAVFEVAPGHPALALLNDNDIESDGQIILKRVQAGDGRTRASVNDQPVGAQLMRQIGEALVEIHGQHDGRALVDPAMHRRLLDAFGGLDAPVAAVKTAHQTWRRLEGERAAHAARIEAARREAEFLRASVDELAKLKPLAGEETELAAARTQMMQAEKIAGDLEEALSTLGGSGGPVSVAAGVLKRLERKAAGSPVLAEEVLKPLGEGVDLIEAARGALERMVRDAAFDPRQLEKTEERLFALRAAARKYHVAVDDLAALAERMTSDLAALDEGAHRLEALDAEAAAAKDGYERAAGRLTAARRKAATALETAVNAELPALKLERARFMVEIGAGDPGPEGSDAVEFQVQTNPGTRAGPMMKVASGGELSRFLLALKVSLADRGSAPTLIFDEIDTGVGGAVAEAIGQRLARLAARVQVISVTHAPQVAAQADAHLLISKGAIGAAKGAAERIATRVAVLDPAERHEEIARMLSGAEITEEARAAAKRLTAR